MPPSLLTGNPLRGLPRSSAPVFVPSARRQSLRADYARQVVLGRPGRCPEQPVLAISLFDNSGSVTGGNDPVGQRFLEAYLAIAKVGGRCRCGDDLAAVLHFDTPTSGDLQPTSIVRANHDQVKESLAIPPDGAGASLLGASLAAAQKLAASHEATHRIVLVVLSDFLLFDDYLGDLIAFPGDVHAVCLSAPAPPRLEAAPAVTVNAIDHASPPGAVARAVFRALVETRPGARVFAR